MRRIFVFVKVIELELEMRGFRGRVRDERVGGDRSSIGEGREGKVEQGGGH